MAPSPAGQLFAMSSRPASPSPPFENSGTSHSRGYPRALLQAALLGLTVLTCVATAQTPAPTTAPSINSVPPSATASSRVEEVVVSAPEPRYVAATTRDRIGRIWAPVLINGKGPYRLVLDTGATRSAIMQRVADDAGLPLASGTVRLRGVTGNRAVQAVRAKSLSFGELLIENVTLPIVPDAFGGADGVLGGEGLHNKRILIEFHKDRISIARSSGKPPPPGFTVVPFKYASNRGMRVQVMVGSVRATALIDTGAQATVGNLALRQALARRHDPRDVFDETVVGVTEDIQHAARVRVPSISAGKLLVHNASIMFSDLQIFEYWQLTEQPALLIGMDVLGIVDSLVIDYRRNELLFRTAPAFDIDPIHLTF